MPNLALRSARLLVAGLLLLALALTLNLGTALAAAAATEGASPALAFTLPPAVIVGMIGAVLLPLLVGWATNASWSSRGKAILLAGLAAVSGFVTELGAALAAGSTYDVGLGLLTAVGLFLGAVGVHFGFLSRPGKDGSSVSSRIGAAGGIDLHKN